jgi:hypothetical protein
LKVARERMSKCARAHGDMRKRKETDGLRATVRSSATTVEDRRWANFEGKRPLKMIQVGSDLRRWWDPNQD